MKRSETDLFSYTYEQGLSQDTVIYIYTHLYI